MTAALQQVHLRFNDALGQATAVRLRVTDANGVYYAPFGRLTHFATQPGVDVGANVLLDDGPWAIIDGTCEIALPPGRLRIQARKGPEYRPLDAEFVLHPGKLSFRFAMDRWTDLAAQGWYSGDTCCYEMSPHAALLEAMATDLAVIDLLVRESTSAGAPSFVNIAAYSGQQPALVNTIVQNHRRHLAPSPPGTPGGEGWGEGGQIPSRNLGPFTKTLPSRLGGTPEEGETTERTLKHLVVVNTANQSPYGRLLLLNTHRAVYPLSFHLGEKWSLIDWCDQCHRKKGLVIADDWLLRLANGQVAELLDPEFLRRVDAIRYHADVPLTPWFDALNRGFKLPLVGGSGKDSNLGLLGSWRTYAQLPPDQSLNYAAWTEAIRAGRSFVTNGPILKVSVGSKIVVEATSATSLTRLELLSSDGVVAEINDENTVLRLESNATGPLVARCRARDGTSAITSPTILNVEQAAILHQSPTNQQLIPRSVNFDAS